VNLLIVRKFKGVYCSSLDHLRAMQHHLSYVRHNWHILMLYFNVVDQCSLELDICAFYTNEWQLLLECRSQYSTTFGSSFEGFSTGHLCQLSGM